MKSKTKRLIALIMVLAIVVSIDASIFALAINQEGEAQEQEEIQEEVEPVEEIEQVAEPEEEEEKEIEKPEPESVEEEPVKEPEPQVEEEAEKSEEEIIDVVEEEEEVEEIIEGEDVEEEEEILEEEYFGRGLDNMQPTQHPTPTPLIYFAPGSLGSSLTMKNNMRMTRSNGLEPGEVRTSKTATPVPGMVNTWDIKVRIEGRDNDKVETTDVVLVIDRSGSMADDGRMENAKIAAKNFIETMIPADPNLRIAIVSFSSQYQGAQLVTVNRNFTRNIDQLTNSVNGLNALGGTHTQAGIIQGQSLLTGSGADNKFMVLLSDGQPTYSYEPGNFTSTRPDWAPSGNTGTRTYGVYDGNFESIVRGNGNDLISYYTTGSIRRYVNNGLAAIKAGQDARSGFNGLFTIAVQAGSQGTPILEQIATPGMAYSTQNPEELQEIYNRIGSEILTQSALRNVTVTDEMGDGFSLISGSLSTSEGATAVAGASGGNNQTITWTINPAVDQLVAGTDDVRFAEMTYRVEINDDILDLPGAKTNEHQLFETNKVTNLSYLDINDTNKQVSIDSPMVDPVLLKIKKNLTNPMNPEDRIFNVEISKEEPNGFNQTVGLVPNADYVWSTKLRHEGNYKVEEVSITGTGFTDLDQFDISYMVDGEAKDNFGVNHINGVPRGDVTIEVTNTEHGDATPDEPLIRVSKTFSGLTQEQIDSLNNFKITITSESNSSLTRDLLLNQGTRVVETNGDITYKWEIEGWPAGTYNVVENGHELTNYTVVIENGGTVTTTAAEINWKDEDEGLWKKPNTQLNNDLTKGGEREIPNIVATKLSSGSGIFVWTETRLSASQRLAVIQALSGWSELGLTADNGYWYSGDDIKGDDFYFRGYRIQYDFETGILHIPQSNQWALIISGAYQFTGGDPADIAVKNSYTLDTVDVTIEKEVTGNLGDKQGEFDFTLIINGDEYNAETFKLSHGQSKTLTGIPANAVLTLMEDARGHDVTVIVGNNTITPIDGKYTINLTGEGITIKVTNENDEEIDTGISFDNLPYILILGLVSLGLGVMVVRRRYSNR